MSFKIDNIVVDRVPVAYAEDTTANRNFLYMLTQITDPQIEINAESTDAKDANGNLVKKFYKGKTGTFQCTSAMIDFNILGSNTGSGKEIASDKNQMVVPRIMYVKFSDATTPIALPGADVDPTTTQSTLKVATVAGNGTVLTQYKVGEGTCQFSEGKLTFPTPSDQDKKDGATRFVVKYDRVVKQNAVAVKNKANKFPKTIRLTLKCLCIDPCDPSTLRAAYIVLPSFQPSPETTVELKTESELSYKGDLQIDYCSADKTLYEIYMVGDDVEDDEE